MPHYSCGTEEFLTLCSTAGRSCATWRTCVKKFAICLLRIEAEPWIGRKRVREPDCGPLAAAADAIADAIVASWVALSDKCLDIAAPAEENR
jgi:hypothetical protein